MNKEITLEQLASYETAFDGDRANRIAMDAVTKNGVNNAAVRFENAREMRHTFNISLEQGDITNQKQSGRCWMFAALNTMRFRIIKKLGVKTFELSQNYALFFDKLEKSNYFLESILETLNEPTAGRLVTYLLSGPLGDGGQWDMFANLVEKYGVVPKEVMPETAASSSTREIIGYLTEKLREFACTLRTAYQNGASMEALRAKKDDMMQTIYNMLCISLGKPPVKFDFEVKTPNGFVRDLGITPQSFFKKYVDMDLSQYISLINAPTTDKPYGKTYTVAFLGNVAEGRPVKCSVRDGGVMDLNALDLETLFNTEFTMDKAQRLDYGQSLMTHAMVFQGVNIDDNGKPNRWRVENSWGKDAGVDGYYIMSDAWFDEYMYQVVVDKKYLTEEQRNALEQEPITRQPWDPMGSLASVR